MFLISKASRSDVSQMVELTHRVFGPYPKLDELYLKWIASEECSVLVAKTDSESQSKIVGLCVWDLKLNHNIKQYECFGPEVIDFIKDKKIGGILSLAILPEYRRNKLGSRLSMEQINWLKNKECDILIGTSWVSGSQDNSQHLFVKAGFKKLGESRDFIRQQLPAGASCSACNKNACDCNSLFFGIHFDDFKFDI